MSQTVIKVENLGKLYRLGEVGTGTISHDLNRWWARIRGKEDPFARIGETNDRTTRGSGEYVWSLKNVNFEVKQGEVVGIIGRNGAGKSTMLKILSKVTAPTTGSIKIKGRIASLLEVGTGFHPELTGRQNIYLNGAILGMHKSEIDAKFDAIVDFASVERYIDTPVKRYSSGMYVRLAFAVAAFLEPEILIIDEVLAVGDAEFQKKCLGRMRDVSKNEGRTVLFVSHNTEAVANLCTSGLILENGGVAYNGPISVGLQMYSHKVLNSLKANYEHPECVDILHLPVYFKKIELLNKANDSIAGNEPLELKIKLSATKSIGKLRIGCRISTLDEKPIGMFFTDEDIRCVKDEVVEVKLEIKHHQLTKGFYSLDFSIGIGNELSSIKDFQEIKNAIEFKIEKKFVDSETKISVWNSQNWGSINFQNITLKECV